MQLAEWECVGQIKGITIVEYKVEGGVFCPIKVVQAEQKEYVVLQCFKFKMIDY